MVTNRTREEAERQIRHWLGYLEIAPMSIAITYSRDDNIAAVEFVYHDKRYSFQSERQDTVARNMWAIANAMEAKVRLHEQKIEEFAVAMEHYMLGSSSSNRSSRSQVQEQSKEPYAILGISPSASWEEIQLCYKRLVKAYHPDMSLSEEAKEVNEVRFAEINQAMAEIKKERGEQ